MSEATHNYKCASETLSSRWQITGLPRVQDNYFTDCSAQSVGKLQTESCTGSCFTFMFDDPDIFPTQAGSTVVLVVRGCHTTITSVVANRSDPHGDNTYCEYDFSHPMANSKGEQVTVRALTEFCSSTNCNNRQSTTPNAFSDCDQQTVGSLIRGEVLNCYECTPQEGKKLQRRGQKMFIEEVLLKATVHFGGGYQIAKSCSNINILGIDNACVSYDVLTKSRRDDGS
ncbi:hypothetical protein KIN20_005334 [Parelaphostrongylus tenuis]|uniref:Uncharacterized protein n=1 Tax=Parelaphostrongylus tenuis TaxID=148309 RepID=A0AAD5ML38_PARTN|nr:hypothetical protein KIN20_005334 [Parelaphostrongylus tenuis]